MEVVIRRRKLEVIERLESRIVLLIPCQLCAGDGVIICSTVNLWDEGLMGVSLRAGGGWGEEIIKKQSQTVRGRVHLGLTVPMVGMGLELGGCCGEHECG